jgi:GxxExxY protein
MDKVFVDSDITGKIIGCAMKVHSALGNGFQELIYQRSLEVELQDNGLDFQREFEMPIYYKGRHVGTRRVDFLVNGNISVELKAIIALESVHLAQALNYLEAYNLRTGLLINFGAKRLQFHRLMNKKFVESTAHQIHPMHPINPGSDN